MTQPFRDHPERAKSLHMANKILTAIIFVAYPLLLIWLYVKLPDHLLRAILVPFDGFIGVSVFRYLVNRRRPYEEFGVAPVIPKDTSGKSFPSRHVFSAAIIAFTFLTIPGMTGIGAALVICAVGIAVIRVISGVHYISDVVAAFVVFMYFRLLRNFCGGAWAWGIVSGGRRLLNGH